MKLSGEGIYNLNVVKEFRVTNSYLGLDMDVRRCQNDLPIVECSTKNYIDSLLQECGCLPFSIRIYKKVVIFYIRKNHFCLNNLQFTFR